MTERNEAKRMHDQLSLAGFRSLATAAGFFQLTRELKMAGVISAQSVDRVLESMLRELLENLPRSLAGKSDYEDNLRKRLARLLSGEESLGMDADIVTAPMQSGAAEDSAVPSRP